MSSFGTNQLADVIGIDTHTHTHMCTHACICKQTCLKTSEYCSCQEMQQVQDTSMDLLLLFGVICSQFIQLRMWMSRCAESNYSAIHKVHLCGSNAAASLVAVPYS